jgi:hypothetical protein
MELHRLAEARSLAIHGELSPFHETYGYYAQGVEEATAVLPEGWKERLIVVRNENTRGASGLCLEIHELLISKYAAGRDKDHRFSAAAARHGRLRATFSTTTTRAAWRLPSALS